MRAFQTNNLALACTLFTCGVPFFEADGKPVPVINFYDRETLATMTDRNGIPIYKGRPLEDSARHAWKSGRPGVVVYAFQDTPDRKRITAAFNQQQAAIKEADAGFHGTKLGSATAELDIEPEAAAMLLCQFAQNRKKLRDMWKVPTPILAIHGASKPGEKEDGKHTSTSSLKCIRLDAPKSVRDHICA